MPPGLNRPQREGLEARGAQDFHEASFRTFVMRIIPRPANLTHTAGSPVGGADKRCRSHPETRQETTMKWETPAASDMRFGFEITMYIANR
ncbi:pyrroloquinoline quinone precursor peptide PqqA [Thauera sp. WB-2]|nr:pyrroloquinoline quinone precursor peptide PqqA [Thauera sp. WB-2]